MGYLYADPNGAVDQELRPASDDEGGGRGSRSAPCAEDIGNYDQDVVDGYYTQRELIEMGYTD